jgi:glycosyltransferase involved in cell wall biosynthesis
MSRLCSITITKNNAADIGECLDSLAFCDERIVVDSGSDDDTVRIARERGALVTFHPWEGFGPQKNFALTLTQSDWILWLDADERITPELAQAIQRAIAAGDADGYWVSRLSEFCGRPMRHSGWHPDWVLRLFRRSKGRWTDGIGHDHVICEGKISRLGGLILHYPVRRIEDSLAKIERYSTVGAQMIVESGRRVWFITGIVRGFYAFLRTYVLRLGFLDAHEGFLLAVANAEGTYYRYMKAWLMTRDRKASCRRPEAIGD